MKNYKLTIFSSFVGIFIQAVVCNLTALLFIPLMSLYGLTYVHLGALVAINFFAQVTVDVVFCKSIDRIGYKRLILPTIALSFLGLILFALSPTLFPNNVFAGIVIATLIFASASGLLELLLSPLIDAIPSNNKGAFMSLMHSFYAWGQVVAILITTVAVFVFGKENWQFIVLGWTIIPLICFFMFLKSEFPDTIPEGQTGSLRKIAVQPFYILCLCAIFFGAATEVVMNQWTSVFAEKSLELPKVVGDMLGMCGFAVMLGVGRTFYGIKGHKLNMNNVLILGSILSVLCYAVVAFSSVNWISLVASCLCGLGSSLLWPGTLVVASEHYPKVGAWLFALLAAAGDIGAGVGNWITGMVVDGVSASRTFASFADKIGIGTEQLAIRIGLGVSVVFPIICVVIHIALKKLKQVHKLRENIAE